MRLRGWAGMDAVTLGVEGGCGRRGGRCSRTHLPHGHACRRPLAGSATHTDSMYASRRVTWRESVSDGFRFPLLPIPCSGMGDSDSGKGFRAGVIRLWGFVPSHQECLRREIRAESPTVGMVRGRESVGRAPSSVGLGMIHPAIAGPSGDRRRGRARGRARSIHSHSSMLGDRPRSRPRV